MNKAIIFWLALLLLFCGGAVIWAGYKYSQRGELGRFGHEETGTGIAKKGTSDEPLLTRFTLTDRSGKKIRSQDLAGKVQVVSFFFSACPTACPRQNRQVETLVKEFGTQGVKFVSITCDPDTDSPAVLADYARQYHSPADQWYFLTGELKYLRRVGAEIYLVPVDKQVHSEKLIVVDRWGKVRGRYHWEEAAGIAELKRQVKSLLAEKSPPAEGPEQPAKPRDDDDDGLIDPVPEKS